MVSPGRWSNRNLFYWNITFKGHKRSFIHNISKEKNKLDLGQNFLFSNFYGRSGLDACMVLIKRG